MKTASTLVVIVVLTTLAIPFSGTKSEENNPSTNYQWVRAIDTGIKTWPRWVIPISNGDGTLFMIAKEGTWSSKDGLNWTKGPNNAGAAVRPGVAQAFFKEKLWLLGGMNDWSEFTNEVWSSTDGATWRRVVDRAPWTPRRNALVTVFNHRLWLFGGAESSGFRDVTPRRSYRDVWQSDDGVTWKRVPTILPESEEQVVVFKQRLWLLGKAGAWSSADGINWTSQGSGPPFSDRRAYGAVVYNDKIWLFGGIRGDTTTNEVWSTADGITWVRERSAPWYPRGGAYSVVFGGKLWIYGGKTGTHYKQADDVWYMTR